MSKNPGVKADRTVVALLAQVMWQQERDESFKSLPKEDRKAAFKEAKGDYLRKSRKVLRKLEARGVEFSLSDAPVESEDA